MSVEQVGRELSCGPCRQYRTRTHNDQRRGQKLCHNGRSGHAWIDARRPHVRASGIGDGDQVCDPWAFARRRGRVAEVRRSCCLSVAGQRALGLGRSSPWHGAPDTPVSVGSRRRPPGLQPAASSTLRRPRASSRELAALAAARSSMATPSWSSSSRPSSDMWICSAWQVTVANTSPTTCWFDAPRQPLRPTSECARLTGDNDRTRTDDERHGPVRYDQVEERHRRGGLVGIGLGTALLRQHVVVLLRRR